MVNRRHPNQRRSLPILNQSQVNPKAALAAWAGRHGPKASPLITLLTVRNKLIIEPCDIYMFHYFINKKGKGTTSVLCNLAPSTINIFFTSYVCSPSMKGPMD